VNYPEKEGMSIMELLFKEMEVALEAGDINKLKQLTQSAINQKIEPQVILNQGLIRSMLKLGTKFKNGEVYIPEVLMAARAMNEAILVLKPLLGIEGLGFKGKFIIGTVKSDLHDIGKNLVGMMLKGAGYQVVDLGVNVPAEVFVQKVKEEKPQILGISALLTTTLGEMGAIIDGLKTAGLRDGVKVMIGGAPVTEKFAMDIGADAYAEDAASAVELSNQLLGV
jgi:corrinoid protein of di/trimethylamine methyltransferase